MRTRLRPLTLLQLFLLVLTLPWLMGQSECNVNQDLVNTLNNLVGQKFKPAAGQTDIFISNLSFIDAETGQMYAQTEESLLINKAVEDGIARAMTTKPNMRFNAPGHEIKNTAANVQALLTELNAPNATPEERHQAIVTKLMDPAKVDVIVTGSFKDLSTDDAVQLTPMVINRSSRSAVYQDLKFDKAAYICPDPVTPSKKALCANAHEELAKVVKEMLETL